MDNILRAIDSSVVLLVITILIAVLLLLSILKQFVKLVILLLLLAALYAAYLFMTGQNIPKDSGDFFEHGKEQVQIIKQSSGKLLEVLKEKE